MLGQEIATLAGGYHVACPDTNKNGQDSVTTQVASLSVVSSSGDTETVTAGGSPGSSQTFT